jgi:hypothetical protein
MDLAVLNESILLDHFSEFFFVHKEVVLSVYFPGSWSSSSIGNTKAEQIRIVTSELINQGPLYGSMALGLPFLRLMGLQ